MLHDDNQLKAHTEISQSCNENCYQNHTAKES